MTTPRQYLLIQEVDGDYHDDSSVTGYTFCKAVNSSPNLDSLISSAELQSNRNGKQLAIYKLVGHTDVQPSPQWKYNQL